MSKQDALGKLVRETNLRNIWPDEARDFTPWLAKSDNLALLAEELGFGDEGLELQDMEKRVGPFRADILCRNTQDSSLVLIENQLSATDHSHLGQLLTYAAGLEAATIVWIAERITDEHRAALEWLNDLAANQPFDFFGLEIELWRVNDGPLAPKFNMVTRPNDWTKAGRRFASELTEGAQLRLSYWEAFCDALAASKTPVRAVRPLPQNWLGHGIGKTGIGLNSVVNFRDNWVRAEIYLSGTSADNYYKWLWTERTGIEADFGKPLEWYNGAKQDRRIYVERSFPDVSDRDSWQPQHAWLIENMDRLYRTFHDRIRGLGPESADSMGLI